MAYVVLTPDEQDEIIVQTLKAQEHDHFCHTMNVQRYTDILTSFPAVPDAEATLPLREGDPFHVRIAKLLRTEQAALDQVTVIVDKTARQLPSQARIDAARQRLTARESAQR